MHKAIFLFTALLCGTGAYAQELPEQDDERNTIPLENSLEYIKQLEPRVYEFPDGKRHGFRVEDVERILPETITIRRRRLPAGKNSYRTSVEKEVALERLVPLLVAAIREQQAAIEQLKKQVAENPPAAVCGSCGKSCG